MSAGTGLLLLGALWLITAWLLHDRAPGGDDGVWATAPSWIRTFARRGEGKVHFWSLGVELWGLAMVLAGLVMVAGAVREADQAQIAIWVIAIGAGFLSTAVVVLEVVRRRGPSS